jgi:hypothetical protein
MMDIAAGGTFTVVLTSKCKCMKEYVCITLVNLLIALESRMVYSCGYGAIGNAPGSSSDSYRYMERMKGPRRIAYFDDKHITAIFASTDYFIALSGEFQKYKGDLRSF